MVIKIVLGVLLYLSIGFGLAAAFNLLVPEEKDDLDLGGIGSFGIMIAWPVVVPTHLLLAVCSASWCYLDHVFERIREDAKTMRKAQQEIREKEEQRQQEIAAKEEQRQKDFDSVWGLLTSIEQCRHNLLCHGRVPERICLSKRAYELLKVAMVEYCTPNAVKTEPTIYGLPVEMWRGMDGISFYVSSYDPATIQRRWQYDPGETP